MKQLMTFILLAGLVAAPALLAHAQTSTASSRAASSAVVLPTGSEIAIQTNEAIDSQNARVGQTFNAQVAQDVMGRAGEVLIPKGSDATLVIRQVSNGGTVSSPELALDLNSLTVGGRRYLVKTAEEEQQSGNQGIGKNKRTAEMVGGGAALGTLLGAIAGGGKGAAIGAAAGAAVGGTAQVLTKGKEVKVPAETVLKFKLDRPLHLSRE